MIKCSHIFNSRQMHSNHETVNAVTKRLLVAPTMPTAQHRTL